MEPRAAVAHKAGEPLTIETVRLDGRKAGEVLVEIKATGICHTDAYTLSGADPEGLFPAIRTFLKSLCFVNRQRSQFSMFRPDTRANSRSLAVTSVSPRDS